MQTTSYQYSSTSIQQGIKRKCLILLGHDKILVVIHMYPLITGICLFRENLVAKWISLS